MAGAITVFTSVVATDLSGPSPFAGAVAGWGSTHNGSTGTVAVTTSTSGMNVLGDPVDPGDLPTSITQVYFEFDYVIVADAGVTWTFHPNNILYGSPMSGTGSASGHGTGLLMAPTDPPLDPATVLSLSYGWTILAESDTGTKNFALTISDWHIETLLSAMSVVSVVPDEGLTTGGLDVTITGTGFEEDAEVNFDNILATDIVWVSATEITCKTPAHATAGPVVVTVTNPKETSSSEYASLTDGFTYIDLAEVSGVSPNHGPMAGGTTVTLTGDAFTEDTLVVLDGVTLDAGDVTFVDATTIEITTPAHSAGPITITAGAFSSTYTYDSIVVDPWIPPGGEGGGSEDLVAAIRRSPEVAISRAKNRPATNTFDVGMGEAPLPGNIITVDLTQGPIFEGVALSVGTTYEERVDQLKRSIQLSDDAWILNARRPMGSWKDVSATVIFKEIMTEYAPADFTVTYVASDLPVVTIDLDGSQAFTDCFDDITKAAASPISWYLEGKDLHAFVTELATEPAEINDSNMMLLRDPPITIIEDISQVRNRVFGRGAGSTTVGETSPGSTSIEVADVRNFETNGGLAYVKGQVISYTGVRRVSEIVNRGAGPGVVTTGLIADVTDDDGDINPNQIADGPIRDTVQYRIAFVNPATGIESSMGGGFGNAGAGFFTTIPQVPNTLLSLPTVEMLSGVDEGFIEPGDYEYSFTFKTVGNSETAGMRASVVVPGGDDRNTVHLKFQTLNQGGPGFTGVPSPHQRVTHIGINRTKRPDHDTEIPGTGGSHRFYEVGVIDLLAEFELEGGPGGPVVWHFYDTLNDASLTNENEHIEDSSEINPATGAYYRVPPTNTTGANVRVQGIPLMPNILASTSPFPDGDMSVTAAAAFGDLVIGIDKIGAGATIGSNNIIEIEGAGTYTVVNTVNLLGGGSTSGVLISPGLRVDLNGGETITFRPPIRKVYRTQSRNPDVWLLNETLENNVDVTYVDTTATLPPGYYDEDIPTEVLGSGTGGQTPPGPLPPIIHFLLVGIPPSGKRSIRKAISDGEPINIWIIEDDIPAQIFLAGRQGGTGVREYTIEDTAKKTVALRDRVRAELTMFSMPLKTITWGTTDPNAREARMQTFNLTNPPLVGSFLIQEVQESEIHVNSTHPSKKVVTASNVRFTLEDLLNRALLKDEGEAPGRGSGGSGFVGGGGGSSSVSPAALSIAGPGADDPFSLQVNGTPSLALLSGVQLQFAWKNQFHADQELNGHKLTGVADPTNAQDAATMAYVDTAVAAAVPTVVDEPVTVVNPVGGFVYGEIPAGAVNGVNAVFTTSKVYVNLRVFLNGIRQKKTTHYTETSTTTFTLTSPPLTGDVIAVDYNGGSATEILYSSFGDVMMVQRPL